jgi:methionyl-tRNA formyltransferase
MWITTFSQTGSEIYQVSKSLGRFPDRIVSNRSLGQIDYVNKDLRREFTGQWVFLPKKPTVDDYKFAFGEPTKGKVVTLHGFLRIVPPEICDLYEIFNGHPGDIITYPQLKGKDPQAKAVELGLPTSGSVIHKVTAGVDEGPILAHQEIPIAGMSLFEAITKLHANSIDLWCKFLKNSVNLTHG